VNLMLNFPLPNSGELDAEELKILGEITRWMAVNSEGIYASRPWKVCGDGPGLTLTQAPGMNERNRKDLTAQDVRFTTKGETLYAFVMGWPDKKAAIPALALGGKNQTGKVRHVELLGHKGKLKFTQNEQALTVEMPPEKPSDHAIAFKVAGAVTRA
jgi:alpha-L-fucosidase